MDDKEFKQEQRFKLFMIFLIIFCVTIVGPLISIWLGK